MSTSKSRKLNPSERRQTMRESFKFYNALTVAGIYQFPSGTRFDDPSKPEYYFAALKQCVKVHPMLATIVKDVGTSDECYVHLAKLDLHDHVNLLPSPTEPLTEETQDEQLVRLMERVHNTPELAIFNRPKGIPPWRIDILPLPGQQQKIFISFAYSHTIGDGMSGPIFHKTFLAAVNENHTSVDSRIETEEALLPMLPHLPVSLSYLLTPALGHYLPRFISRLLGLRASVSGSDAQTWVGRQIFDDRLDPEKPVPVAVEVFCLNHATLLAVVTACRSHGTKLTALLNELIALCFSRRLDKYHAACTDKTNLVSCVPLNLRRIAGLPENTLGNIASATYSTHPITRNTGLTIDDSTWSRARLESAEIAKSANKLQDQPMGLLAWISDMKSWMGGQIGQTRDSSWELSNLLSFDGGKGHEATSVIVEKMFFCQPGNVVGYALDFSVVSVKGGDLVGCVSWQVGALDLGEVQGTIDGIERKFVGEILQDLMELLQVVAKNG